MSSRLFICSKEIVVGDLMSGSCPEALAWVVRKRKEAVIICEGTLHIAQRFFVCGCVYFVYILFAYKAWRRHTNAKSIAMRSMACECIYAARQNLHRNLLLTGRTTMGTTPIPAWIGTSFEQATNSILNKRR